MSTTSTPTETMRPCPRCNGMKTVHTPAATYGDAYFPATTNPCYNCNSQGHFAAVDVAAIVEEIKGRRGLCTRRPKSRRAYYVWRMARFHGGVDVTMPMTAISECGRDPFLPELDALADAVAKRVFGTDMAAANRWGGLLGITTRSIPGLPSTAYEGGPVVTAEKPVEEMLELM